MINYVIILVGIYFLISGIRIFNGKIKTELNINPLFNVNKKDDFIKTLGLIKIFIGSMFIFIVISILINEAKLLLPFIGMYIVLGVLFLGYKFVKCLR